jgi:hydroxyethylthiazole kinase-like uncharacterized protein yjeF
MKAVVTARQMAEMDRYSIDQLGLPGLILMENAGRGITQVAVSMLGDTHNKLVHIFCGPGNNGGDGFVVARHLLNHGVHVETFLLASRDKIKGDALTNLTILENMGHSTTVLERTPEKSVPMPDLVIDALLGTGAKGALQGLMAEVVAYINSLSAPVLSIDIPTGINADTGAVEGQAIQATRTATMALLKQGLLFSPAREHAGKVDIIDISMPATVIAQNPVKVFLLEKEDIAAMLPQRSPSAYKNQCGTVAVVAGSRGYTGAAVLAAEASMRTGTGLTYLCVPKSLNVIFETKSTEVITWPFDDANMGYLQSDSFPEIVDSLNRLDIVALGPGIGQHAKTAELVFQLLQNLKKPMVLDADGLNICAQKPEIIKDYRGELVLTPHPGELSRLLGMPTFKIAADRISVAREIATSWKKVLVLKGGPTIIAVPDGRVFINSTGNAGMATAGSGDVLTGVIAGLLAQGLPAEQAALSGVNIHGLAGDIARDQFGEMGMIAGDILRSIPPAILSLQRN